MTAPAFPPWHRAAAFLRRLPCKPLLVLTFLCLVVKEEYPFSNFPMYASFTNRTYYVYLADGADQPLPTLPTIGITTPTLKKIYDGEMRREAERLRTSGQRLTDEDRRAIGERIVARLKNSPPALQAGSEFPKVLRLYRVDIELTDGRFQKRRTLIAEA